MKETYTAQDTALSASSSHEKRESYCANPPLVLQDLPEDDDEPPIRQPSGPEHEHVHVHENQQQHHENPHIVSSSGHIVTNIGDAHDNVITIEKRPFDRDASELAQYLHTSLSSGLDDSEVQNRLKLYGNPPLESWHPGDAHRMYLKTVSKARSIVGTTIEHRLV